MKIHRYYIPGAAVFITQVVQGRKPVLHDPRVYNLWHTIVKKAQELYPFDMLAYVILPDHFHMIIQPTGEHNFSKIMHSFKPNFTKAYKKVAGIQEPLQFWQMRFWDHVIRDDRDMENHLSYIHYNPVKHGLVADPRDWPESSFLEWEERGLYPATLHWQEPQNLLWGE
jgi:putative transposase